MSNETLRRRFWSAVEDCLVEFYGHDPFAAHDLVCDKSRIMTESADPKHPELSDLIYHADPWHVAWNMMGHPGPPNPPPRDSYERLLRRRGLADSEDLFDPSDAPDHAER
jgi:hypothetical protein